MPVKFASLYENEDGAKFSPKTGDAALISRLMGGGLQRNKSNEGKRKNNKINGGLWTYDGYECLHA